MVYKSKIHHLNTVFCVRYPTLCLYVFFHHHLSPHLWSPGSPNHIPSGNDYIVFCLWNFILLNSFTFFTQPPKCHPSDSYESVSILLVILFCSLEYTFKWNLIFVFSDWTILLTIIFSRSIHAVAKNKIFLSSIILYDTAFFIH